MDRTERFYLIHRLLSERRFVTRRQFIDELGISRATFQRDLEYMRERLFAPIEWDASEGGYRFSQDADAFRRYLMPGLWLNEAELYALLACHRILSDLQPGVLDAQISPLVGRIEQILSHSGRSADAVKSRVKLAMAGRRRAAAPLFEPVAAATLARRRLRIAHFNRFSGEHTAREISPQRIVHWRDTWYVDSWCHLREDLRTFAIDALESVDVLEEPALEVPMPEVAARFDTGYGIFQTPASQLRWATIRFTPYRARWAENEIWHPDQKGRQLPDGSYELEVPFRDARELVTEVLRQGSHAQVVEPPELRQAVADEVERMGQLYGGNGEAKGSPIGLTPDAPAIDGDRPPA